MQPIGSESGGGRPVSKPLVRRIIALLCRIPNAPLASPAKIGLVAKLGGERDLITLAELDLLLL